MAIEAGDILKKVMTNRKARHEYHITDTYSAGIQLTGTEVKSIRQGKLSLQEAYCLVLKGEALIKDMHIAVYDKGSYNNHEPMRLRKLLLKKKEIMRIKKSLDEKGMTLIPLMVYFNARNIIKVEIGLGKGKKLYDKREGIKERDTKREMDREMKNI